MSIEEIIAQMDAALSSIMKRHEMQWGYDRTHYGGGDTETVWDFIGEEGTLQILGFMANLAELKERRRGDLADPRLHGEPRGTQGAA